MFSLIGLYGCEEDSVSNSPDGSSSCNCSSQYSPGNSVDCSGTTQQGDGCDNMTLNMCGYCYLHTSQCN